MNQSLALLMAASFAVCAALLWFSAELGAAAAVRPAPIARALLAAGVWLGACALWWPAHALRGPGASNTLANWALPWLAASVLAVLAGAAAVLWEQGRRAGAVALAAVTPFAAFGHAMFDAGGVLRLTHASGAVGAGLVSLCLPLALLALHARWRDPRFGATVRIVSALGAAWVCCLGVAFSVTPSEAARAVAGPQWLTMAGLVAISAVLVGVLRQPGAAEAPGRVVRPAIADPLTGLPTRLHFEGRLEAAARQLDARKGAAKPGALAVLFIDLDGFKPINDSLGHAAGDRVLAQAGRRLKAAARGVGMTARVGSDQFLLLANAADNRDAMAQLAERVIDSLGRPCRIGKREVALTCSVGIAMYPEVASPPGPASRPDKLIARADAAMYAAKRAGGARHCFYSPEMDTDVRQNFDLLRDLRLALANDELELFFQPKIDAGSGKVTAAEALLRWNHPTRGMVMPGNFIALAERSGLIGPLGNWVIEAACRQARAWRDKGLRMRVAINLSAHQMRQDDIAERISEALTRHRIHPSLLTCEITETAAMEDTGATQETFRSLGAVGAHLSIDDFGTGYSSLSYLRQLPARELKIDASFVKDVDSSADARAVIDAVVKLAHALGLKVVAEGVETLRQHKILVELGCDELQGYLFARPMTARALLLWAMDDRSSAAVFRNSLFDETHQAARPSVERRA